MTPFFRLPSGSRAWYLNPAMPILSDRQNVDLSTNDPLSLFWRDYMDALIGINGNQIVIARNDQMCPGLDGAGNNMIVIGIGGHYTWDKCGEDSFGQSAITINQHLNRGSV